MVNWRRKESRGDGEGDRSRRPARPAKKQGGRREAFRARAAELI